MPKMREATYYLEQGTERTRVSLTAWYIGEDIIACIYNENAHLGAVALSQYDHKTGRVSTSLITALGHKDDAIAQQAAYLISKHTKKPACVVAGVHIDNITQEEIVEILNNANNLVQGFLLRKQDKP